MIDGDLERCLQRSAGAAAVVHSAQQSGLLVMMEMCGMLQNIDRQCEFDGCNSTWNECASFLNLL